MDPVLNGPEIYKYKGCVSGNNTMYIDHMIRNRNTTQQNTMGWFLHMYSVPQSNQQWALSIY